MPTECLFRDDSYLKECEARVVAVTEQDVYKRQLQSWRADQAADMAGENAVAAALHA